MGGGVRVGGKGTWGRKQGERERVQGRCLLENVFSCFTCCSRRGFLCVEGKLDNEGHIVMVL